MDEHGMSKEEFHALLDAEHERGRKELKKFLKRRRPPSSGNPESLSEALERHQAVTAEIQRLLEAARARRGER